MSQPTALLEPGTEVLFFGQTGKARYGIIVGLAAAGFDGGERHVVGYAVETKWEVRPVLFDQVVAPFAPGEVPE